MRKLLHMEGVDLVSLGQAKDAAACNANLRLFDVAKVAAAPIIHTNADNFVDYKIDGDDGIIAVGDIPQQQPHLPLVANNTDDDNAGGSGDENNDDDNDNDDDDNKLAAVTNALEGN